MKQNTKSETELCMYTVWHMTQVTREVSMGEREHSFIGSRKRVIHEKRKSYTH